MVVAPFRAVLSRDAGNGGRSCWLRRCFCRSWCRRASATQRHGQPCPVARRRRVDGYDVRHRSVLESGPAKIVDCRGSLHHRPLYARYDCYQRRFGFLVLREIAHADGVGLPLIFVPMLGAFMTAFPSKAAALLNAAHNTGGSIGVSLASNALAHRANRFTRATSLHRHPVGYIVSGDDAAAGALSCRPRQLNGASPATSDHLDWPAYPLPSIVTGLYRCILDAHVCLGNGGTCL